MHRKLNRISPLLPAVLAGAALLSACGRNDDRTAGQKVDDTIAKVEQKSHEVASDAREAGRDVRQAATNAGDAVASKSRDMAITAAVKARLAGDAQLSALAIDVDTVNGRVVLHGSAPDPVSRGRASDLAGSVDGVVAVNNDLSVQPR